MKHIMFATYHSLLVIAIIRGKLEGAWEEAIAPLIEGYAQNGHSEAEVIMQAAGGDARKAAYIITGSSIPQ